MRSLDVILSGNSSEGQKTRVKTQAARTLDPYADLVIMAERSEHVDSEVLVEEAKSTCDTAS